MRVRLRARRAEILGAAHAHLHLGLVVIRLEIVIADRPVATDAVQRLQLHVIGQQAPRLRGPVPGGAADHAQIAGLVRLGAALHEVVVVRRILRMRRMRGGRIRRLEIRFERAVAIVLDDAPAIDTRAGFEHQHVDAGFREFLRDLTGRDAGADDHDVGGSVVCHGGLVRWVSGRGRAASPSSRARRARSSASRSRRRSADTSAPVRRQPRAPSRRCRPRRGTSRS